jgi:hypothetical protein
VEAYELVVPEGGVVRSHDVPVRVDPHRRRDVDDAVEVGDAMLDVDQRRVRRRGGLEPGAGGLGAVVEGDGDDGEPAVPELRV